MRLLLQVADNLNVCKSPYRPQKTYVLQEQLNDVYVGPRFELEDRYTEVGSRIVCDSFTPFCHSLPSDLGRCVGDDDVRHWYPHSVRVHRLWPHCPLLD